MNTGSIESGGSTKDGQLLMMCPNNHFNQVHPDAKESCGICGMSPLNKIPIRTTISHSFLSDLDRCSRYAYYRHLLSLRAIREEKTAMNAGTLWHMAMQAWHGEKGGTPESRKKVATKTLLNGLELFPDFPLTREQSKNRSLENLVDNIGLYSSKYGLSPFNVLRDENDKPLTEINFAILLQNGTEPPVVCRGIIDAIVEYDGRNYTVEYKSTAMLNTPMMEKFRTDSQISTYIMAAREILGIPIYGAIVDIVGLFGKVDPSKHLVRIFTSRTEQQLEGWKNAAVRKYMKWEENKETGNWDQSTGACNMWNRVCEYMEPCLAWGTKGHKNILQSGYVVEVRREAEGGDIIEDI